MTRFSDDDLKVIGANVKAARANVEAAFDKSRETGEAVVGPHRGSDTQTGLASLMALYDFPWNAETVARVERGERKSLSLAEVRVLNYLLHADVLVDTHAVEALAKAGTLDRFYDEQRDARFTVDNELRKLRSQLDELETMGKNLERIAQGIAGVSQYLASVRDTLHEQRDRYEIS